MFRLFSVSFLRETYSQIKALDLKLAKQVYKVNISQRASRWQQLKVAVICLNSTVLGLCFCALVSDERRESAREKEAVEDGTKTIRFLFTFQNHFKQVFIGYVCYVRTA